MVTIACPDPKCSTAISIDGLPQPRSSDMLIRHYGLAGGLRLKCPGCQQQMKGSVQFMEMNGGQWFVSSSLEIKPRLPDIIAGRGNVPGAATATFILPTGDGQADRLYNEWVAAEFSAKSGWRVSSTMDRTNWTVVATFTKIGEGGLTSHELSSFERKLADLFDTGIQRGS
jgi:hypothetical protein